MHTIDSLDSLGGPAVIRSHAAECIQSLANLSLFVHFGDTERHDLPGTSRLTVITMHHNVWVANPRAHTSAHTIQSKSMVQEII